VHVLITVIFALLGSVTGSFLNVLIDRLPAGQSPVYPPSHCSACGHRLAYADLVPLLSFIWLKGRCRYCHARISRRIFIVELVCGLAFGGLYWYTGPAPQLAVFLFYFCLLLTLGIIDLEQGLILNRLVYPGIVAALVISLFSHELAGSLFVVPSPLKALGGSAAGLAILLVIALVSRGGMGWGDVKMAALMGAMLGFPEVLVGIFAAILSGGLVAVLLLLFRIRGRKQAIPFGPFLALGTLVALFWGQQLIDWYLGYFI
jgi:leader peptidase (prepilin peptidase)/N-methyltransferase